MGFFGAFFLGCLKAGGAVNALGAFLGGLLAPPWLPPLLPFLPDIYIYMLDVGKPEVLGAAAHMFGEVEVCLFRTAKASAGRDLIIEPNGTL